MSRAASVALLGVVIAAAMGAWWLLGGEPPRVAPRSVPQDDLEMLAALRDASPTESAHDVLLAAPGTTYLARASDRTVVEMPEREGGAPRVLARLDAPARGMAYADGNLWVTSKRAVLRIPAAGGDAHAVAELAAPGSIASDGRWIFVVDADASGSGLTRANHVVRLSASDGARTVLGGSEGEIPNVVIDDASVYWADRLEGSIVTAPKAGGPSRVLATDRGLPGPVAVRGDALTWIEKRSESLWSMPKTGGSPARIAQDFAGFANLVVDAHGVYWTNEAAVDGAFHVLSVSDAGEPEIVSDAAQGIDALASDGEHLYWARSGDVTRLR